MGLIPAVAPVRKLIEATPAVERSNITLLHFQGGPRSVLPAAASFGLHDPDEIHVLAEALKADVLRVPPTMAVPDFVRMSADLSARWTWLDIASRGLHRDVKQGPHLLAPTVVVTDKVIPDLALFWNLRMLTGIGSTGQIIPFPADGIGSDGCVRALVEWLKASRMRCDFCQITSLSCPRRVLDTLARSLRSRLRNTKLKHVDVCDPMTLLPLVIGYEEEAMLRVDVSAPVLTWQDPEPHFAHLLTSSHNWIVELVLDAETGRSPAELCLPPRDSVMQVLNAAWPPRATLHRVPRVGFGVDSINFRANNGPASSTYCMPKAREILCEVLRERKCELLDDEKRPRYEAAVRLFGGLTEGAHAFTGDLGRVISALWKKGPLTLSQIRGRAKLGSAAPRVVPQTSPLLKRLPPHSRSVSEQRFGAYRRAHQLSAGELEKVLVEWEDRAIVVRRWCLDKCQSCGHSHWTSQIDLQKPMTCPGCHSRLQLRDEVPLGYELNASLCAALEEGLIPVVLTGRFLYNLTRRGFLWLPGVKGSYGGDRFDIDVFASCDGHLVLAECKDLRNVGRADRVWAEVADQFSRLVELAKALGADMVTLGTLAETIPVRLEKVARTAAGDDISVLLLARHDLEGGHRARRPDADRSVPHTIEDMLPPAEPTVKIHGRARGSRTIWL